MMGADAGVHPTPSSGTVADTRQWAAGRRASARPPCRPSSSAAGARVAESTRRAPEARLARVHTRPAPAHAEQTRRGEVVAAVADGWGLEVWSQGEEWWALKRRARGGLGAPTAAPPAPAARGRRAPPLPTFPAATPHNLTSHTCWSLTRGSPAAGGREHPPEFGCLSSSTGAPAAGPNGTGAGRSPRAGGGAGGA